MMERARRARDPEYRRRHDLATRCAIAGKFDWRLTRINTAELSTVVQNTVALAPTGPQIALGHRAGTRRQADLLPFEQEMVDVVNKFMASRDPARAESI